MPVPAITVAPKTDINGSCENEGYLISDPAKGLGSGSSGIGFDLAIAENYEQILFFPVYK